MAYKSRDDIKAKDVVEMLKKGMSRNQSRKHFKCSIQTILNREKEYYNKEEKKCEACGTEDIMHGNRKLCWKCFTGEKNNFDNDFLHCT